MPARLGLDFSSGPCHLRRTDGQRNRAKLAIDIMCVSHSVLTRFVADLGLTLQDLATEFLDEVERMPEVSLNISSFAAHVLKPPNTAYLPAKSTRQITRYDGKRVSRTRPRVPFSRSLVEPSPYNPPSPLPHGFIYKKSDFDDDEDMPLST